MTLSEAGRGDLLVIFEKILENGEEGDTIECTIKKFCDYIVKLTNENKEYNNKK